MAPCKLPFMGSLLLTTCNSWSFSYVLIRLGVSFVEFLVFAQMLVSCMPFLIIMLLVGITFLWDETEAAVGQSKGFKFKKYRNLQVLEKLINAGVRFRIFPATGITCPWVQIVGGFAVVKLHSSLEFSYFVLFLQYFSICVFNNIHSFGGAGAIYSKSQGSLIAAKREVLKKKVPKIARREIKSLTPLRIWFGSNFADELTCLVIQDFCINQTISLLLME